MNAADVLERGTQRLRIVDGKRLSVPVFESPVRLDELVDAGLYFGRKEPTLAAADESSMRTPIMDANCSGDTRSYSAPFRQERMKLDDAIEHRLIAHVIELQRRSSAVESRHKGS